MKQSITCFFDPSTCQYQRFSIPEKIVYYIAKNPSNATTFQKLVQTCKYFFKVNPVVVVPLLECYAREWYATDDNGTNGFQFDNVNKLNFKFWLNSKLAVQVSRPGIISSLIPKIYKNDAAFVCLMGIGGESMTFDEFLFATSNAEELSMSTTSIKYENGEIVPFEIIVQSFPKLKSLKYRSKSNGRDFTTNTAKKLMEVDHLENLSRLYIDEAPEELNIETMFKFITENKQIEIFVLYRRNVSDAYKELIREYSNRLKNEKGCNSKILFTFKTYGLTHIFAKNML